jgi:hypothetical protein
MIYFLKVIALCFLTLLNNPCAAQTVSMPYKLVLADSDTLRDLDLAETNKKTIGSMIDRTITECGRQELNGHLLQPICDVNILRDRQSYIQFFVNHVEHATSLRDCLRKLKEYEASLKQENKEHLAQQALDRVYFTVPQWQCYNTNPYALDLAYGMHIISLCGPFVEHVAMHIGIDMLAKGSDKEHHDDHGHGHHHHDHHHHHGCSHHHHASALGGNAWVYYGLQGLHWGLHLPGLYDMACDIKERAMMIKYLQHQVIQIAHYVEGARQLYELMTAYEHSDLAKDRFQPYKTLNYFFAEEPGCSDEMKRLFELLNTSTFQGDASYFSHAGNILAAYKCYENVQQEFQALVHAVGQVDMYLALASLVHSQTVHENWAFVKFIENGKVPSLVLEKVRNLFVTEQNATNFSSKDALHRVVMGDNGVGKSTYLMSIGHALFIAQTFGIVPAAHCEMTPFSQILTFRIIQDDFTAGISRFYAECARVEKILHGAQTNQGFSCVILDEPFVHTNNAKGAQHFKQSLVSLHNIQNTMSIVATHHQDVEPSWYIEHLQ